MPWLHSPGMPSEKPGVLETSLQAGLIIARPGRTAGLKDHITRRHIHITCIYIYIMDLGNLIPQY